MNIFDRALEIKVTNLNLTMVNSFSSKDLYLNNNVFLNFIVGQEIYFLVIKTNTFTKKNTIYTYDEVMHHMLNNNSAPKAISISLESLKPTQFKEERKIIDKFIKKVGG